jgi:hypothetical protein
VAIPDLNVQGCGVSRAAAVLSEVIGRSVDYVDVPPDQFRTNLACADLPGWTAEALVALYQAVRAGHAATVTKCGFRGDRAICRGYCQLAETQKDVFTGD